MASILLISPPRVPGLKLSRGSLPVSLLYLSSVLRQAGHSPIILDLSVTAIPAGIEPTDYLVFMVYETIMKIKPELIGINCFSTMHFSFVRMLTLRIREMGVDTPICLGGIHPTFFHREIMEKCLEFDFIVSGEGEEQIVHLADAVACGNYQRLKDIQALSYRDVGEKTVITNPRKTFISDLDSLPFPAYDMINFQDYYADHSNWHNPKQHNIRLSIPVFTSRSCPFNCNFCSAFSVMGRRFRRRNPQKVVDEIEILVRDFDQNYFSLTDDNVNLDKKHFIAICDGIVNRGLDIQLCIPQGLYLNAVDEDIIRSFVRAGGITVSVPIESGNSFIRNQIIRKNLSDETIYKVVKILKKYNLFTVGLFIMGFAEDTTETLNDTLVMIRRLGLDISGVNTLIPFPGTRLYQQASRDGLLLFKEEGVWGGEVFFDPLNRQEFFLKPYAMELDEMKRFRKIFDELYFTSERAQSLNC